MHLQVYVSASRKFLIVAIAAAKFVKGNYSLCASIFVKTNAFIKDFPFHLLLCKEQRLVMENVEKNSGKVS